MVRSTYSPLVSVAKASSNLIVDVCTVMLTKYHEPPSTGLQSFPGASKCSKFCMGSPALKGELKLTV